VHASAPGVALYLPASHAEHASPVNPALHTHTLLACAVCSCQEFGEQGVHAVDPDATLYVPAAHSTHVRRCDFVRACSALHARQRQSVRLLLPAGLELKAGHAPPQAWSPGCCLNVPDAQVVQKPLKSPTPAAQTHASMLTLATPVVVSSAAHA